jgi:Putative metal-binding motif
MPAWATFPRRHTGRYSSGGKSCLINLWCPLLRTDLNPGQQQNNNQLKKEILMKKNFAAIFGLILGLSFLGASPVQALSSYLSTLNSLYGTSGTIVDNCAVCHIGSPSQQNFNSFGGDWRDEFFSNGFNATTAYHDIEPLDSDGDGFTNIDELTAHTLPGDSTSFPQVGPTCTDQDGDGFALEGGVCGPTDCNDGDPSINPGAEEICTDGVDNNCNGLVDAADPAAVSCPATNPLGAEFGVFRAGKWYLDANRNGMWDVGTDTVASFGLPTDIPISGDWNGNGTGQIGVYRNGAWYLDANGNGAWDSGIDLKFTLFGGTLTDVPVTGDWNGDGATQIGVYRNGTWYLDANSNGAWDVGIDTVLPGFGLPTDIPVTGDWNGDGTTQIGVYRNGTWYLDANSNGAWDAGIDTVASFGLPTDLPVTGDWNQDGTTQIGVYRNGKWYLDTNGNGAWDDGIDTVYPAFGTMNDMPITVK